MFLNPSRDLFQRHMTLRRFQNKFFRLAVGCRKLVAIDMEKTSNSRKRCAFVTVHEYMIARERFKVHCGFCMDCRIHFLTAERCFRTLDKRLKQMGIAKTVHPADFVYDERMQYQNLLRGEVCGHYSFASASSAWRYFLINPFVQSANSLVIVTSGLTVTV